MRPPLSFLGFGLMVLAACTDFPDLEVVRADPGTNTGFPELIAIDPLLATAADDTRAAAAQAAILAGRVSQLRARSRALQHPVIDRTTRRTMAAAVRRHIP